MSTRVTKRHLITLSCPDFGHFFSYNSRLLESTSPRGASALPAGGRGGLPAYLTWDRSATCAVLGGRAVLLLGDSLTVGFFDTLVSALQPLDAPFADRGSFPHTSDVCSGSGEKSSLVQLIAWGEGPEMRERLREAWSKALESMDDDMEGLLRGQRAVFVINRGAHYQPLERHLDSVYQAITFVRSMAPNATIFWRTTPSGHASAFGAENMQNKLPLLAPPPLDSYAHGLPAQYHWGQILAQNEATVANLPLDVLVIDVEHATVLRHDSHPVRTFSIDSEKRDGLHYCVPGPIDMWVELWAAVLRYAHLKGVCTNSA